MKINHPYINKIKALLTKLENLEWDTNMDKELEFNFFAINDIFENIWKNNDEIWNWRKIVICFQRRSLFDVNNAKNECITMIKSLLEQHEKN